MNSIWTANRAAVSVLSQKDFVEYFERNLSNPAHRQTIKQTKKHNFLGFLVEVVDVFVFDR